MKKLFSLLKSMHYLKADCQVNLDISSVEYDSRKCVEASVFVAIPGNTVDGNEFIPQAIANGAKVVVSDKIEVLDMLPREICCILVENSRQALAQLSAAWYDYPYEQLDIIGVTGTNGKTTITFLLNSIFRSAGFKTGLIGTTGIFIDDRKIPATHTTPESLELYDILRQMADEGVSKVFMEVSSHALHQKRVFGINFKGAVFTNLTHDHLDYHKTFEEYAAAKKLLFDSLGNNSIAILNGDDKYYSYMVSDTRSEKKIIIGRTESADILISNEKLGIGSSEFTLKYKESGIEYQFGTNLSGRFNIDNAAISAVMAMASGISAEDAANGLLNTHGAPGRMEPVKLKNGAVALVDYAHTPDALQKALNACREVIDNSGKGSNRLICVFGCGGDRDKTKRPLMGRIAAEIADIAIITSDNPRTEEPIKIIGEIAAGVDDQRINRVELVVSRAEAIRQAVALSSEDDIILVAGKGHEDYQVIGKAKQYFSDAGELAKYS